MAVLTPPGVADGHGSLSVNNDNGHALEPRNRRTNIAALHQRAEEKAHRLSFFMSCLLSSLALCAYRLVSPGLNMPLWLASFHCGAFFLHCHHANRWHGAKHPVFSLSPFTSVPCALGGCWVAGISFSALLASFFFKVF